VAVDALRDQVNPFDWLACRWWWFGGVATVTDIVVLDFMMIRFIFDMFLIMKLDF
jgi:hypothetical protein